MEEEMSLSIQHCAEPAQNVKPLQLCMDVLSLTD